jgi:hypothetical protein
MEQGQCPLVMTRNGDATTGVSLVKRAFGRRFGIIATPP